MDSFPLFALLLSEAPVRPGAAYWAFWALCALVAPVVALGQLGDECMNGRAHRGEAGRLFVLAGRLGIVVLLTALAAHGFAVSAAMLRVPSAGHLHSMFSDALAWVPDAVRPPEPGLPLELHLTKLGIALQLLAAGWIAVFQWPARHIKQRRAAALLARLEQNATVNDKPQQSHIRYY